MLFNPECLVETKHADSVCLVKACYHIKELLLILSCLKLLAQRPYFLADIVIVHKVLFHNGLIIADLCEAVYSEC